MYISYHSLHDIDLKQLPVHNDNEQFNLQCVLHIHRRSVLSLTLALSRMRSENIAIMSRDPLCCGSRLIYCRSGKA